MARAEYTGQGHPHSDSASEMHDSIYSVSAKKLAIASTVCVLSVGSPP